MFTSVVRTRGRSLPAGIRVIERDMKGFGAWVWSKYIDMDFTRGVAGKSKGPYAKGLYGGERELVPGYARRGCLDGWMVGRGAVHIGVEGILVFLPHCLAFKHVRLW